MGKIGEWREILRNAAQRAAFWARMSWEEARENGNGYSEAAGSGESKEERNERARRDEPGGTKELWVEKEAEIGERGERAEKIYKDGVSYDAEERERKRNAMRERFEKEGEMREGYFAEEILKKRYKLLERAAAEEKNEHYEAAMRESAGRLFSESERSAGRAATVQVMNEGRYALIGGWEDGGNGYAAEIAAGEIEAEEILRDAAIEAAQRRGSYGGSAEMKREMLKMKMSEAEGGGEVKIEMINNNQFKSEVDMDEITDRLTERIVDLMARSADGVYM